MGTPHGDDERDIQEWLRGIAAMLLLGLFAVIVLTTVFGPFFSDRSPDSAVLLGLAGGALTSAGALLGVQILFRNGGGK